MITTYTGKKLSFIDPQPEDICIEDIAHHLSLICRFNGACRTFYSVAQHSVHVAEIVLPGAIPQALLHDAGEAYYGDITSSLKEVLKGIGCGCCHNDNFEMILKRIDQAIFDKFNIPYPISEEVKQADRMTLNLEWSNFMSCGIAIKEAWTGQGALVPWNNEQAEAAFLKNCREVGIR